MPNIICFYFFQTSLSCNTVNYRAIHKNTNIIDKLEQNSKIAQIL